MLTRRLIRTYPQLDQSARVCTACAAVAASGCCGAAAGNGHPLVGHGADGAGELFAAGCGQVAADALIHHGGLDVNLDRDGFACARPAGRDGELLPPGHRGQSLRKTARAAVCPDIPGACVVFGKICAKGCAVTLRLLNPQHGYGLFDLQTGPLPVAYTHLVCIEIRPGRRGAVTAPGHVGSTLLCVTFVYFPQGDGQIQVG